MGRRGNRNKNSGKAKTRIARKKFRQNICSKCQLCHPSTGMRLCYNKLYLKDPEIFINTILPGLIERHAELKELSDSKFKQPITDELQIFKEVFCDSNVCPHCVGNTRKALEVCYTSFIAQTKSAVVTKKNIEKKPEEPAVMMVIMSNNDEFREEVKNILDKYNNNKRILKEALFGNHNKYNDQDSATEYCT